MSKRREFRPLAIDALEDRVVLSHVAAAHAVTALQTTFPGTVDAQNTAYILALYNFVGRTPNPGGVEFHEDQLTSGRVSRFQMAQTFLNTPEGATSATAGLFQLFLNRNPSPSEVVFFNQGSHGQRQSLVTQAARILATDEYFVAAGGSNQAFVSDLYEDVLGRDTDLGAQAWVNALNNGASRQQVALQILKTPEGAASQVFFATSRVLGRVPNSNDQIYTHYILRGGSLENVIAALLHSQEFFNNAQTRFRN